MYKNGRKSESHMLKYLKISSDFFFIGVNIFEMSEYLIKWEIEHKHRLLPFFFFLNGEQTAINLFLYLFLKRRA